MLTLLPDLTFPVTPKQVDALMTNLAQLSILDAGVHEQFQRALGIHFHVFDTWLKSGGRVDYRGLDGHRRLMQDARTFLGGTTIGTRHGDLAAAHLAIDYHDTQMRLKSHSQPPLSDDRDALLNDCRDLAVVSPQEEARIGLLLDYLGKRPLL